MVAPFSVGVVNVTMNAGGVSAEVVGARFVDEPVSLISSIVEVRAVKTGEVRQDDKVGSLT